MAKNEVTKLTGLKRTDASASKHTDAKVLRKRTTIVLSEDVTKWLHIQGINNGTSMSAEIERLARAEMEKQK
jgi:hypothetical protein